MTMHCPACHGEMREIELGGVKVDLCESGCRGLWFDWFELQKFDETHETAGAALAMLSPGAGIKGRPERLACPRCPGIVLRPRHFTPMRQIEIDECPGCGGIWLDAGELAAIREQFACAADRESFIRDFVASKVEVETPDPSPEAAPNDGAKYLQMMRMVLR